MTVTKRRTTRVVRIGRVRIGGNHPIAIQSMTSVKTARVAGTVRQIKRLEAAGCELVRVAVKDGADADAILPIRKRTSLYRKAPEA